MIMDTKKYRLKTAILASVLALAVAHTPAFALDKLRAAKSVNTAWAFLPPSTWIPDSDSSGSSCAPKSNGPRPPSLTPSFVVFATCSMSSFASTRYWRLLQPVASSS